MNASTVARLSVAIMCGYFSSCSRYPSRVAAPKWDADAAAAAAINQYDSDGDGELNTPELEASPPLKSALKDVDTNHDGKLTNEEIAASLQRFGASRVGLISPACLVLLNGKPLSGATVRFIPEQFLGELVETAEGTTDESGVAIPSVPEGSLPHPRMKGIRLGFYRVEISHQVAGRESLPSRYNTESQLGQFVPPECADTLQYRLQSR